MAQESPEPYRILEIEDEAQRLDIAARIIKKFDPELSEDVILRDIEIIRDTDDPLKMGSYMLTILGKRITIQVDSRLPPDPDLNKKLQDTVDAIIAQKRK